MYIHMISVSFNTILDEIMRINCFNKSNFKIKDNCLWSRANSNGFEPRYFSTAFVRNQYLHLFAGKNIHDYCFNTIETYSFGKLIKF